MSRHYIPPPVSQIEPNLFIADVLDTYKEHNLSDNRISVVVSLSDGRLALWRNLIKFADDFCNFLDKFLSPSSSPTHEGSTETSPTQHIALVHCQRGRSRAPTLVTAYLMRKYQRTHQDILADLKLKRKIVKPNPNFIEQLEVWHQVQYNLWEDDDKTIPKESYRAYLERRAERLKAKGLTGDEPIVPATLDEPFIRP
ncbi:hypothetical protein LOZ12_003481 [Ophidiomyces ophidiicola]|uniref:uncharacterized protein n=1 Tax=Ophidiomyces ophidiicola TaxID=1387563 RepID=UPI0020C3DF86|nr:uncharacterized protein LOZ57_006818 [Ophidiomyces ophidiicola]KAI1936106.1 hypothetical protein LOZ57_006818 [Ophidiomyces ophidiicola]KAI1945036.1 hypothetical protein LOZ62_003902 [Ophidiomyces ophidiicola]KAI1946862.1 hypothetical protein LOZ59_006762 [Ophidiomyces ophidiicola]KAI1961764.1 hypothetical protein LOZ56_006672 [Ophidiomyces ophidiicola]KAI2005374.1 hypothetical protein LOZ50_003720 [Ophidiomyces ophidiicola]